MSTDISHFFSLLHREFFKPSGFKKIRHRFVRERDGIVEVVDFQGSDWNAAHEPWTFYINICIGFKELIPKNAKSWLEEMHGRGRIGRLVSCAPQDFDFTVEGADALKETITDLVSKALAEVPKHERGIYDRAKQGLASPLPIPDSWK